MTDHVRGVRRRFSEERLLYETMRDHEISNSEAFEMEKLDYRKAYKELYLPASKPAIIEIPTMQFASIDGRGDPNGEAFSLATEALYSLSYAVKMSYRGLDVPPGYYDFTVFPLEALWSLSDEDKSITDKSNYAYTVMIRQPDFCTNEVFERYLTQVRRKKPNQMLEGLALRQVKDGLCCQMLHTGSYDDELESFAKMEQFCQDNGYTRCSHQHREIYLSDPRKTKVDKLKTVLRFQIDRRNV